MKRLRSRCPLLVAVICTLASAYGFYRCSAIFDLIATWGDRKLDATQIDFSQPGEFRLSMSHDGTPVPHGFLLYLEFDRAALPSPLPQGQIRVEDGDTPPRIIPLSEAFLADIRDREGYVLYASHWSPKATPIATIQVVEGSPAWAGLKPIAYGRYWPNPHISIWLYVATATALVATVSWAVVLWRMAGSKSSQQLPD